MYVWRYAKKILHNPELSLVYDEWKTDNPINTSDSPDNKLKASRRQIFAFIILLAFFGLLICGLLKFEWYFRELAALYVLIGIVVGLVAGLRPSQISESFNEEFKNILLGAFVVGVARAVAVVLNEGNIIDTIIHASGQLVGIMTGSITAIIMLIIQGGLNFLIPSGSG